MNRYLFAACVILTAVLLCAAGAAEPADFSVVDAPPSPVPTAEPTPVPPEIFPLDGDYPPLSVGSKGATVYWLKLRLYELGYAKYKPGDEDYTYTEAMSRQILELQKVNGLEETGIADTQLQAFIYSDACLPGSITHAPTAVPRATTEPIGPSADPELPVTDPEGFLPLGSREEFVYEDVEGGLWIYLSDELSVRIESYQQVTPSLQWFETRVRIRGTEKPRCIFSKGRFDSTTFQYPGVIARNASAVVAVSDDCYTYRTTKGRRSGVIIRNGEVVRDDPFQQYDLSYYPPLDVMAFLPDGTMAVYDTGTVTSEELLSLGVENSYSFGPILVRNGREYNHARYGPNPMQFKKHPRNAIGMIAPNDYLFITVTGRQRASEGVTVGWLVDRMLQKGVQTAFNLDGGNSASVIFMGRIVNRRLESSARDITSMIAFGTSDLVPAKLP